MKKFLSFLLILSLLLSSLIFLASCEDTPQKEEETTEQSASNVENEAFYTSFTSYGDGTCSLNSMALLNASGSVLQIPETSNAGDKVVTIENLNFVIFPTYLTAEQFETFSEAVKAKENAYNYNKYVALLFKSCQQGDAEYVEEYPLLAYTDLYVLTSDVSDNELQKLVTFATNAEFDLTKAVEDLNKLALKNGLTPNLLLASAFTSITFPSSLLEISYTASQSLSKLSYYTIPNGVLVSGSPAVTTTENKNMRSSAINSVCFLSENGSSATWHNDFATLLKKYQSLTSDVTISTASAGDCKTADLIVVSYGESALKEKTSCDSFRRSYIAILKDIRIKNPNSIILLQSVSAVSKLRTDASLHASYNAMIKSMANGSETLLYADTYSALALSKWTENDTEVLCNRLFSILAENCYCLAVSSQKGGTTGTKTILSEEDIQNQIYTMASASTYAKLKMTLDDDDCYLDIDLYNQMSNTQRVEVAKAFFAHKPSTDDASEAVNLKFLTDCYQVAYVTSASYDNTPIDFKKIVIVGDSITAGVGATTSNNRWVAMVYQMVKNATGSNKISLDTEYSISGTKLTDWTNNKAYPAMNTLVQKAVIDKNPDMLWIAYGINDLNQGVSYETYYNAFDEYLNTIRTALPECVIVIVGLTYEGNGGNSALIEQYNNGYRVLAEKYDCAYADVYNQLQGSEWLLSDGLHPSDIGYFVMADVIYSAILTKCNLKNTAY